MENVALGPQSEDLDDVTRENVALGPGPAKPGSDSTHDVDVAPSFGDDSEFIGQVVSGYKVESYLGAGGAARVFLARSPQTRREVAIKVFGRSDDKAAYARFMREAEVVVGIRHPNVVSCYGIGEFKSRAYMVLELMPGGDLTEYVEKYGSRLDQERALRVAIDVAKGVQEVHNAGYIHRDIKPGNVFLDAEGVAKIGDLGLAHRVATEGSTDAPNRAAGTPAFMSPEQARGEATVDIRTDIYSLGATLFFLLTGRPPFTGKSSYDVVDKILNEPSPDPKVFAAGIPDQVATVVNVCLEKDKDYRYSSVQELVADLSSLLGQKAPTRAYHKREQKLAQQRQLDAVSHRQDTWRRWRLHFMASAMVAVFLVGVLVLLVLPDPGSQQQQQQVVAEEGLNFRLDLAGESLLQLEPEGAMSLPRPDGVELRGGALEADGSTGLIEILRTVGDFTVILDLTNADGEQTGPARILTISGGPSQRNLTIGQLGDRYEVRVRTTRTSPNGLQPHLLSPREAATAKRQYVVFVRDGGVHRLYVDGKRVASKRISGELSTWDTGHRLLLGNEVGGRFPWRGQIHRLRIATGVMEEAQVAEAYDQWLRRGDDTPSPDAAVGAIDGGSDTVSQVVER